MNSTILRIAFQEEISASYLKHYITPEIKKKFHISENQEPFESGIRSAVYENSLGQIVAFTDYYACKPAYKSVGKNSDILPEIYDLEEIVFPEEKNQTYCVIVMEKLKPIDEADKVKIKQLINKWTDYDYERVWPNKNDPFELKFYNLFLDMQDSGIEHYDLHPGNIAWTKDGDLKLIDWESIGVPQVWV